MSILAVLSGVMNPGKTAFTWNSDGQRFSLPTTLMGFASFTPETTPDKAACCVANFAWHKGAGYGPQPRPPVNFNSFVQWTSRPTFPGLPSVNITDAAALRNWLERARAVIRSSHSAFPHETLLDRYFGALHTLVGTITPGGVRPMRQHLNDILSSIIADRIASLGHVIGKWCKLEGDFLSERQLVTGVLANRRTRLFFTNHTLAVAQDDEAQLDAGAIEALWDNWCADFSQAMHAQDGSIPMSVIQRHCFGFLRFPGNVENSKASYQTAWIELFNTEVIAPRMAARNCEQTHVARIATLTTELREAAEALAANQALLGAAQVSILAHEERETDLLNQLNALRNAPAKSFFGFLLLGTQNLLSRFKPVLNWFTGRE